MIVQLRARPERCRRPTLPSPFEQCTCIAGTRVTANDLHPRPERRRAFALEAAADQGRACARTGLQRKLLGETGLADARLRRRSARAARGRHKPSRLRRATFPARDAGQRTSRARAGRRLRSVSIRQLPPVVRPASCTAPAPLLPSAASRRTCSSRSHATAPPGRRARLDGRPRERHRATPVSVGPRLA